MLKKQLYFLLVFLIFTISLFSFVQAGELKVTQEHPFLVNGTWIPAQELKVGDKIQTLKGENVTITSIENLEANYDLPVYNLEVQNYSNFVLGKDSLIVHNSNTPKIEKIISKDLEFKTKIDAEGNIKYLAVDSDIGSIKSVINFPGVSEQVYQSETLKVMNRLGTPTTRPTQDLKALFENNLNPFIKDDIVLHPNSPRAKAYNSIVNDLSELQKNGYAIEFFDYFKPGVLGLHLPDSRIILLRSPSTIVGLFSETEFITLGTIIHESGHGISRLNQPAMTGWRKNYSPVVVDPKTLRLVEYERKDLPQYKLEFNRGKGKRGVILLKGFNPQGLEEIQAHMREYLLLDKLIYNKGDTTFEEAFKYAYLKMDNPGYRNCIIQPFEACSLNIWDSFDTKTRNIIRMGAGVGITATAAGVITLTFDNGPSKKELTPEESRKIGEVLAIILKDSLYSKP